MNPTCHHCHVTVLVGPEVFVEMFHEELKKTTGAFSDDLGKMRALLCEYVDHRDTIWDIRVTKLQNELDALKATKPT